MTTVVLVTGANKDEGIGRGLVTHYLQRPDTIVVPGVRAPCSSDSSSLSRLDCAPGSKVILVKINAKSNSDASHAVQALVSEHGIDRLDVVIANTGIFDAAAHQKAAWPLLSNSNKPVFLLNSAGAATMSGIKTFRQFPLSSYAASKMLANFLVLRLHIEHPNLIAFAVHPGSVVIENRAAAAAALGAPVEGISVKKCVSSLLSLVDGVTLAATSGTFVNVDGTPIPW